MRNGKHYVAIRMTPDEKRHFLDLCNLCKVPEITLLYWLVKNKTVHQRAPDNFFNLIRLLTRIHINVGNIGSVRSSMSEETKYKYYRLGDLMNKYECRISLKGILADPHYGENRK